MIRPTLPDPTPRLGLALGAAVIVAAALGWAGLDALERARTDLATVDAQARIGALAPAPLLGEGLLHRASDRAAATAAMTAALRLAAADRRLLVERLAALPSTDPELSVELIVSGPEADVFHFARTVESARPAIRFARWRVARTGPSETAIRLEARAVGYREAR